MSLDTIVQAGPSKDNRQKQLKDLIGDTIDYEQTIFSNITKSRINEAMDLYLSEEEKVVLQLKFGLFEPELSFLAIAAKTQLSKTTVKTIYMSALEKLKMNAITLGD